MDVSIIIPAFNEEKNISLCLDSIFENNFPRNRFEVIVVDNGSTDRTRDVVSAYDVTLLRDDDKNISGLRNMGALSAKGEVIAFVDADCIVSPSWLSAAEKYFDTPGIVAWGTPPLIPENPTWVQNAWYLVRQKENKIQEVDWLESMNLFVRNDLFKEIGGFNESLITAEDVDFSYRISEFGTIISDSTIKVYHMGEAATITQFVKKELWRGIGNLSGIKSHGIRLNEIPSLIIPGYFGLFLPLIVIGAVITRMNLFWYFFVFFYVMPNFVVLYKVIKNKTVDKLILLGQLVVLLQFYFACRTFAVVRMISK
ncbi:MAG: glycosyltransferase [Desulfobacteraceae bacterium]|nr:glycosyltransferase [Desulfobacteraceae bacterium]